VSAAGAGRPGRAGSRRIRHDARVPTPLRSRLRRAVLLVAFTLIAGGLAGLAVADPFHLRHARWFTAALVLLTLLLAMAAFAVVLRGVLRVFVLVIGGVAALAWVGLVLAAAQLTATENRVVDEAADGGRRLLVVEDGAPQATYAVVLQSGSGLFEQETVVYQGVEGMAAPAEVRWVDGDTVEVRTGGCVYRSEVEPVTLAVDPVHRPLRADGC
jgi:hypothetical protein